MASKRSRSRGDTDGGSYKRKKRYLVDEEAHSVVGPAQSFSDLSPRLRSVGILTSGGDSQGVYFNLDTFNASSEFIDGSLWAGICP